MDVIYLAFANDSSNPLPTLQEEDQKLNDILLSRQMKQNFMLFSDSFASISLVADKIGKTKDDLSIFLYSGHAERDSLLLEGQAANAEGIAYLLGQCPNLKLVFLNGCSTKGQVFNLLENGIPVVIATSAPINDKKAAEFSTRFFQGLNDQCSIKEAFELAKGEIMARYTDIKPEVTSILKAPGSDAGESLWGLYSLPEKEIGLDWKLPSTTISVSTEDFIPNELLIDSLLESLAPHLENVQQLLDAENAGEEPSVLDKRKAILGALPHPISEQFRKLLVDSDSGSGGQIFYNRLGEARIKQIIVIYNTVIELLGYTILADLWEATSRDNDFKISDSNLEKIKEFFLSAVAGTSTQRFLDMGVASKEIMDKHGIKYFVEEIGDLTELYNAKGPIYDAVTYLEFIHTKMQENGVSTDETNEVCIRCEEKLGELFTHLGFVTNYVMASVKDIDVLKYKRFTKTRYKHNVVNLEQTFVGLEARTKIDEEALDSNSVLIIKKSDPKASLNLSPFIIDENAFNNKASIAKLYYFDRYDKPSETFVYKHVYKPQDQPLLLQKQKQFRVLRDQFNAFAKSIFNQEFKDI